MVRHDFERIAITLFETQGSLWKINHLIIFFESPLIFSSYFDKRLSRISKAWSDIETSEVMILVQSLITRKFRIVSKSFKSVFE